MKRVIIESLFGRNPDGASYNHNKHGEIDTMQTGRFMNPEQLHKGLCCTHDVHLYTACPKCAAMLTMEIEADSWRCPHHGTTWALAENCHECQAQKAGTPESRVDLEVRMLQSIKRLDKRIDSMRMDVTGSRRMLYDIFKALNEEFAK